MAGPGGFEPPASSVSRQILDFVQQFRYTLYLINEYMLYNILLFKDLFSEY
jgi:hypothetical protein